MTVFSANKILEMLSGTSDVFTKPVNKLIV